MRRLMLVLATALALLLGAGPATAPASAADTLELPLPPPSLTRPPPGYRLSARQAVARAAVASAVQQQVARGRIVARPFLFGDHDWQVNFYHAGREVVRIQLDGDTGRYVGVWTGPQIAWPLARGAHGPKARRLHLLLVVAGVLFLLPFVNPRRRPSMMHLDLLVLLSFGISHFFSARGDIYASVPLVYPPLLYLIVRMIWLAQRSESTAAPPTLRSWMGTRALLVGVVALLVLRYAYDLIDGHVNDVGYASVYGANTIASGLPIYNAVPDNPHLDTYGPVVYLTYLPFELLVPLKGLAHAHAGAARLAAITFDFFTAIGLFFVGRRLRPGRDGVHLGALLAWGFVTYPWSLLVLSQNTNDALVAMLLVFALLAFRRPGARGALLGAAAAAKFAPFILAGLFGRALRERGLRPLLIYGGALVLTIVVVVGLYLPDGGVREFWDETIGFQLTRSSPFSIWGLHPTWKVLHAPVTAVAGLLAAGALFYPRERSLPALAAAGTALLAASQLTARHWYYFYLVWFLPYALVALFSRSYATSVRNSGSSSESAVASNTS